MPNAEHRIAGNAAMPNAKMRNADSR